MRIALCDDDVTARQALKTQLNTYCSQRNLCLTIDCFSCGEDFLKSSVQYEIVFMDIYLTGMSGTEAVQEIRKTSRCSVVFMTVSREHAVEAFGLNATHYLIKPITEEALAEAMQRCLERIDRESERLLEVKSRQGTVPILMKNIIYIEIFNKISIIHTEKKHIQTYMTLDALLKLLEESVFMRAQRSFIVNMNFIESFFFDRIVLKDGTEIILSRKNRSELKAQYQHFLFNLARRGGI
ncbi:sensory transduction protein LytR [Oxobacter pfennigii]|uniref:Stage 0 sporulation protein A homolog n=1 Tax=Oxobacter pfennigii TaxID=36849 RepID=A0A0P8YUX9_9CLOT|nr:LytTR family DNA-binding domain-containing protein [Oxobacter pfennigii]KPU43502.1 sensory transduction protein LytR [Oxobacter pfennigii]